jgi:hypothetical protein
MSQQRKLQERVTQAGQAQPPAPQDSMTRPGRMPGGSGDDDEPQPGPGISAAEVRGLDRVAGQQAPKPTPTRATRRGGDGRFKPRS